MKTELDRLAIDAAADRLAALYVQVQLVARAQRISFVEAGEQAVAHGLIAAADWALVREAVQR